MDEDENGLPKKKILELAYEDFIKKFVKHILPSGFQKNPLFWHLSDDESKGQIGHLSGLVAARCIVVDDASHQGIGEAKNGD